MNSTSTTLAGRAVAATIISRTLRRVLYVICAAAAALIILSIWLTTTYSGWWALLLPIGIAAAVLGILSILIVNFIIGKLQPRVLSREEKRKISSFVDDINEKIIAGQIGRRSPIIIGLLTVFAYFRHGRNGAVKTITVPIEEIKDLRVRFSEIIKLFE